MKTYLISLLWLIAALGSLACLWDMATTLTPAMCWPGAGWGAVWFGCTVYLCKKEVRA